MMWLFWQSLRGSLSERRSLGWSRSGSKVGFTIAEACCTTDTPDTEGRGYQLAQKQKHYHVYGLLIRHNVPLASLLQP